MTDQGSDRVYVSAEAAEAFTRQIMLAHGLPDADAGIVAHCLVSADLRGVDTHGIARLPGYLDRVRRGLINAKPTLKPERVPKAHGFEEILIPGEPEARLEAQHRKTGIPYSPHDLAPLHTEAAKAGVQRLPVSDRPLS